MKLEIFLARRYLSSHRGRGLSVITWIALAGVIVGVMSLVTVLAVMSGFDQDLRLKILGNNAHILVQLPIPDPSDKGFAEKKTQKIESISGIKNAMPVVYGAGFLLSPRGGSEGVFIKGVSRERVQKVLDLNKFVEEGNWKDFEGNAVILGDTLAENLHVKEGDEITLLLNRGEFSPLGVVPRMKRLRVSDVFHSGMTQFDSRHAYLPLDYAAQILEETPRSFELRATDLARLDEIKSELRKEFPNALQIQDWISENKDFLSALQLEKLVMAVILGLIILVAAFNICGSLIMVVRDKTKDIAILKSMGGEDSIVLRVFFLQGLFIGLVGTAVGLVLGLLMSLLLRDYIKFPLDRSVYMIDTLPVDIRPSDVILVGLGALIVASIATLYPAFLAAKVIPTEGLKAD